MKYFIAVSLIALVAVSSAVADRIIDCRNDLRAICNGTSDNDTFIGSQYRDVIYGYGGDDALNGFNSNDDLFAGPGDDQAAGGRGNDWISGGSGNDRLIAGCWAPTCPPGSANIMLGGDGADTFGADNGQGGDSISGGGGRDTAFIDRGDSTSGVERCIVNGVQRPCP